MGKTKVTQHTKSGCWTYTCGCFNASDKWVTKSGEINGVSELGNDSPNKFRTGCDSFKLLILANHQDNLNNAILLIKDLKVEVVDKETTSG